MPEKLSQAIRPKEFKGIKKFLLSLACECTQVQNKINKGKSPMSLKEIKAKTCFTTYKDDRSLNPELYLGYIGKGGSLSEDSMETIGISLEVTLSLKIPKK